MVQLNENDYAMLELLAMKPISFLPPFHSWIAEQLSEKGVLRNDGRHWHPTAIGLRLLGCTVH